MAPPRSNQTPHDLRLEFLDSIDQIFADAWNALFPDDYPFIRHEFLAALERSGCTTPETGWTPHHLALYQQDQLIAVLPCYQKSHSYGEYVFDWAWADAYRRHGFDYYPKLVSAIPFTPSTGPRLGIHADWQDAASYQQLLGLIQARIEGELARRGWSSWHGYFPPQALSDAWSARGWMQRLGVQYHWYNQNYRDFEDFLGRFSSRKRKTLRKERRRVRAQGLTLVRVEGAALQPQQMDAFYRFYHLTYLKRSGRHGYLNRAFFQRILASMAQHLLMVLAYDGPELVAAALNFKDRYTLYGRYWGCLREYEFLHFEACYYQGIEYCIEQGLQRFDPGAQGEHKIQRGFEPVLTWSNHCIRDPDFRSAIEQFVNQEQRQIEHYMEQARTLLPFRKND